MTTLTSLDGMDWLVLVVEEIDLGAGEGWLDEPYRNASRAIWQRVWLLITS